MANKKINIIILAAGKGTRMHSSKPKVLHQIGGLPMLTHVINCAKSLNPEKIIVVYGFGGEQVKAEYADENIIWAEQKEQLGTGHAVQQAAAYVDEDATSLIMLGDVPLVDNKSCKKLVEHADDSLMIQSFNKTDPTGYGRIIRNRNKKVVAIIEHKDANEAQRKTQEVNTGIMAMPSNRLKQWLNQLDNSNAQAEYYLTDIIGFAVKDKYTVDTNITEDEWSVTGVNSKQDQASVERVYQHRQAQTLLKTGVTLQDPNRIDVRGELTVGKDVEIDVGCIFEGKVTLESGVKIGAYNVIKDAVIKANTTILPYTHIDHATVGESSRVGPYARLRPGTELSNETHVGNFVELKNAIVGVGSKVNHLSYVGDAIVGKKVNIGAGTITCNYDGQNKFKTIIEDNAFIGSDTQLIAPVTIGQGATIAAGSTITKDAPAEQLTLCRAKVQKSVAGWKRPQKLRK